jgi:dTDP-4-dehydrorhamnose reductase
MARAGENAHSAKRLHFITETANVTRHDAAPSLFQRRLSYFMKILVTGSHGLLGRHVAAACAADHAVRAVSRHELDIGDATAVANLIRPGTVDVVVNCAAMTNVDACETDAAAAFRHNADGPRFLAEACAAASAYLIHISTDYVFDGTKDEPYATDDPPNPISVYGESKLAGERLVRAASEGHAVVRVAGLFGSGGKNFASVLRGLLTAPGVVKGIADNRILPSFAVDVADYLRRLATTRRGGVFHAVSGGEPCSWHDFAVYAGRLLGDAARAEIVAVTEAELKRPAKRPMRCTLAHSADPAHGLPVLRDWRAALESFLK